MKRHELRSGHRCGTRAKNGRKSPRTALGTGGGRKATPSAPEGAKINEKGEGYPGLWLRTLLRWGPPQGLRKAFGDRRHSGSTPLHEAASRGHSELVLALLAAGPGLPRPVRSHCSRVSLIFQSSSTVSTLFAQLLHTVSSVCALFPILDSVCTLFPVSPNLSALIFDSFRSSTNVASSQAGSLRVGVQYSNCPRGSTVIVLNVLVTASLWGAPEERLVPLGASVFESYIFKTRASQNRMDIHFDDTNNSIPNTPDTPTFSR